MMCKLIRPSADQLKSFKYFKQIRQDGGGTLALICDGEIVGASELIPIGSGVCHIGFTEIAKSVRGAGKGTVLVRAVEKEGRKQGCKKFLISAEPEAEGFWEKMGYLGEERKHGLRIMSN